MELINNTNLGRIFLDDTISFLKTFDERLDWIITDPPYGVGIDLIADGVNGLNIEYVRYGDNNDNWGEYTLDTASIGYFRRF